MKYIFLIIALILTGIFILVGKCSINQKNKRTFYETEICGKYIIDLNKSLLHTNGVIPDTFTLQFNPDHTFQFNIDSDYITTMDGKWRHKIGFGISYDEFIFRNHVRQQFDFDGKSLIFDYPIPKLGTKYVDRLVFTKIEDCTVQL